MCKRGQYSIVRRDFLASAVVLLMTLGHFGPGSVEAKLHTAFLDCQAFTKAVMGKNLHTKNFTRDNFSYATARDYPEAGCKASDTVAILKWLEDYLVRPFRRHEMISLMLEAVASINSFYSFLYGRWHEDGAMLEPDYAGHSHRLIKTFISRLLTCFNVFGVF